LDSTAVALVLTMAPRLQWCEQLIKDVNIVPRIEDCLIDELFYQEDEIGEMRHTAFMVECGLEEDPPDGPDVPPVPWGDMLLKQQEEKAKKKMTAPHVKSGSGNYRNDDSDDSVSKDKRNLPSRSRSNDDIDTLAIELTTTPKASPKRRVPKRTNSTPLNLYVVDGESLPSSPYIQFSPASPTKTSVSTNRRPAKRTPTKSTSVITPERTLRSPEDRRKRSTPMRGKLTQTRSGTCHEMATAAARAKEKMNAEKNERKKVPAKRKLTKTRSGTSHMANAAMKAKMKLNAEKEKEMDKKNSETYVPQKSPSVLQRKQAIEMAKQKSASRPAPLVRSLVATNSGTLHGMQKKLSKDDKSKTDNSEEETRIVFKNGKRTTIRKGASKELRAKVNGCSGEKKTTERIVYRNGKKEIIKQQSSFSSKNSDDDFLGDIVKDSDDESVARSEISISTNDSDVPNSRISLRKEKKATVPKSIDRTLKLPTRRSSLTEEDIVDENEPGLISQNSLRSKDIEVKKKKKKKKKKQDDHSTGISSDSISSNKMKKKKKDKKEKESLGLHDSFSSPASLYPPISSEQRRRNQNEAIFGDVQPGCYPSPSSIRANRKKMVKKADDALSPSIIKIEKCQGFSSRPDDVLGTSTKLDPLASLKKKKLNGAVGASKSVRESKRPDDWLGSGKTQKRTWRVKTKTP